MLFFFYDIIYILCWVPHSPTSFNFFQTLHTPTHTPHTAPLNSYLSHPHPGTQYPHKWRVFKWWSSDSVKDKSKKKQQEQSDEKPSGPISGRQADFRKNAQIKKNDPSGWRQLVKIYSYKTQPRVYIYIYIYIYIIYIDIISDYYYHIYLYVYIYIYTYIYMNTQRNHFSITFQFSQKSPKNT